MTSEKIIEEHRPARYTLADELDEEFVIQSNSGETDLRPKSPYFILKLKHFNGNRIFHSFSDTMRVEETYSDGIFNCYDSKDKLIQIADKDAIANLIFKKDTEGYVKLFNHWADIRFQEELIPLFFSEYSDRINYDSEEGMYIIDNVFCVSNTGNAFYCNSMGSWCKICLVTSTVMYMEDDIDITFLNTDDNTITKKTQVVFGKIMFLLFPKWDIVFLDQLPGKLRETVEKDIKERTGRKDNKKE